MVAFGCVLANASTVNEMLLYSNNDGEFINNDKCTPTTFFHSVRFRWALRACGFFCLVPSAKLNELLYWMFSLPEIISCWLQLCENRDQISFIIVSIENLSVDEWRVLFLYCQCHRYQKCVLFFKNFWSSFMIHCCFEWCAYPNDWAFWKC